jgi:diguanylate cyclase (GGDEF)-like protein/PAS domain S-box-containing protein
MPEKIATKLLEHDRIVRETNRGQKFTELVPDKEGNLRHWLSSKFPFHDRSGEVFLGGVSVDITDMVNAQEALRESESRYRQIVEYAGDIIIRCDSRGRVTYLNEMGARVLKRPAEELRGRRALGLTPPRERRRIVNLIREEIADGRTDFYVEMPVLARDGSEIWVGQTVRVLRNLGRVAGFQAISRDITRRRAMEAELRASEQRFRLLYENGPVAYHEIDREGIIQRVNRAECELLGVAAEELVGTPVIDLLAPEDQAAAQTAIRAKLSGGIPLQPFQRTYVRRDGRRVRVEIHENLLRGGTGEVIGIHSILLDVTQRHLAGLLDHDRRELSEMIAQLQPLDRILQGISRMISHQDETLQCVSLCFGTGEEKRLDSFAGRRSIEPLAQALRMLGNEAFTLWPTEGFHVTSRRVATLAEGPASALLAETATRCGARSCWSIPIVSSSRNSLGVLLVFSPRGGDPTADEAQLLEAASRLAGIAIEHRYLTDLLAFQAGHDSLTRLPNRSTFERTLESAISDAKARAEELAVFYVDLDRFKSVNDTFGHSGGDELLRHVGTRLRQCIRHGDMIARVGGDEFALILPRLRESGEAHRVAEAILQAFRKPFEVAGVQLTVTSSIGISVFPRDGLDATSLQRNSDSAMYRVKNNGKNSFRCYGPEPRLQEEPALSMA